MQMVGEQLVENLNRVEIESAAVLVDHSSQATFFAKTKEMIQTDNYQFIIALGVGRQWI